MVYGDEWMPASRDAQTMMHLAYAARDLLDSQDQQQVETRKLRLAGFRNEIDKARSLQRLRPGGDR